MSTVIQVGNVSKSYRLGVIGGGALRDDLHRWWARARGRTDEHAAAKAASRRPK